MNRARAAVGRSIKSAAAGKHVNAVLVFIAYTGLEHRISFLYNPNLNDESDNKLLDKDGIICYICNVRIIIEMVRRYGNKQGCQKVQY